MVIFVRVLEGSECPDDETNLISLHRELQDMGAPIASPDILLGYAVLNNVHVQAVNNFAFQALLKKIKIT